MPQVKKLVNTILVLFILFSIPVTVLVARRSANIGSDASASALGLQISPGMRTIEKGGSGAYTLEMTVPKEYQNSGSPVLLQFGKLPSGMVIINQPLGATKSNNFQTVHIFTIAVDSKISSGNYPIEVVASDLNRTHKTTFSVAVK
jgi:hypothetical protein